MIACPCSALNQLFQTTNPLFQGVTLECLAKDIENGRETRSIEGFDTATPGVAIEDGELGQDFADGLRGMNFSSWHRRLALFEGSKRERLSRPNDPLRRPRVAAGMRLLSLPAMHRSRLRTRPCGWGQVLSVAADYCCRSIV